jgi:hypothetical protein
MYASAALGPGLSSSGHPGLGGCRMRFCSVWFTSPAMFIWTGRNRYVRSRRRMPLKDEASVMRSTPSATSSPLPSPAPFQPISAYCWKPSGAG